MLIFHSFYYLPETRKGLRCTCEGEGLNWFKSNASSYSPGEATHQYLWHPGNLIISIQTTKLILIIFSLIKSFYFFRLLQI